MIAYALMPTAYGDTMVYGVEFGAQDVASHLPQCVRLRAASAESAHARQEERRPTRRANRRARIAAAVRVTELAQHAVCGLVAVRTAVRWTHRSGRHPAGVRESAGHRWVAALAATTADRDADRVGRTGGCRRHPVTSRRGARALAFGFRVERVARAADPLAQIRLFLETLRLGRFTTDAQRKWSLDNIDRETNRLAQLVENILHFARAGRAPSTPATPESTDLAVEIEQITRAFEPLAASRRAALLLDLAPNVVVPLQREAFRQVLLNLLDNAVKYGPSGQTVRVALAVSGAVARVTVIDEGPGVPAKEREAIWTPFFRGQAAAAQAAGGSGIGLAIVKGLVAQMSGRIAIVPSHHGAAFQVELPGVAVRASSVEHAEPALTLRPS